MAIIGGELEASIELRRFGTGWLAGVLGVVMATIGLGTVLCLRYPDLLTVPDARGYYDVAIVRLLLHVVLVTAFALGLLNATLRANKSLGFLAVSIVLIATALGGSRAQRRFDMELPIYFGLDWFLLNLILTAIVFVPLERWLGRTEQPVFRAEWREDLLYFLVGTFFVQVLAFLTLAPATAIFAARDWSSVHAWIRSQPLLLQFAEIVFLTDLMQYWVHRAFHRVPWLWNFHAIHHCAKTMDWLASSRMHLVEIVLLRSATVIPMYVLGFSEPALYVYLIFVFFLSAYVHSNVRVDLTRIDRYVITPRFHHWHHGLEREAIDVNFAVHLPFIDRLFGTYHMPPDGRWPEGYGIADQPVPHGYWRQFAYPFLQISRRKAESKAQAD